MGQSFTGHHFSRMADPRDGGGHSESAPWRRNHNLEAAPIGGPLFAHGNSGRLCKASRFPLDTYATRLLAQALSRTRSVSSGSIGVFRELAKLVMLKFSEVWVFRGGARIKFGREDVVV